MAAAHKLTAYELFRAGHDTQSIASYFRITEAQALEQLSRERSSRLGIPDPYKSHAPKQVPWPSGRVAYVGKKKSRPTVKSVHKQKMERRLSALSAMSGHP